VCHHLLAVADQELCLVWHDYYLLGSVQLLQLVHVRLLFLWPVYHRLLFLRLVLLPQHVLQQLLLQLWGRL
jgi:hypothetical protein